MTTALADRLHSGRVVLMDGAMGTELMRLGARPGKDCFELWNLSRPETIRAVHSAYVAAGAEVVLTHTFQANPSVLAQHGLEHRLAEIWTAALEHARSAAPFVLADIGPLRVADETQFARMLECCGGSDGILLETWSRPEDVQVFAACQQRCKLALPLLVSFTYRGEDCRTFTGSTPEDCAAAAEAAGALAVGANCGMGIDTRNIIEIVRRYRAATALPIFVRPNAGSLERLDYQTPDEMAEGLCALISAGVAMVGGCCGTTPEYIGAFQRVLTSRDRQGASRGAP